MTKQRKSKFEGLILYLVALRIASLGYITWFSFSVFKRKKEKLHGNLGSIVFLYIKILIIRCL